MTKDEENLNQPKMASDVPTQEAQLSAFSQNLNAAADAVRIATPAIIVNNGSRINSTLKFFADGLSIKSSLRPKIVLPGEKPPLFGRISAPWRFAGSMVTFSAVGLGMIYKEKPTTEEEKAAYKEMSFRQYVSTKIRQGFDPKNHIAETIGLCTIPNGALLMMQGIKQSSKGRISKEVLQGAMTIAAGGALNFIPDREKAWQISNVIFMSRAPVAYVHAHEAYKHGFPAKGIPKGDWEQLGKWWANQCANIVGFLYGGVAKDENGNIVRVAKNKAESERLSHVGDDALEHLPHLSESPSATIMTNQSEHQRSPKALALAPAQAV